MITLSMDYLAAQYMGAGRAALGGGIMDREDETNRAQQALEQQFFRDQTRAEEYKVKQAKHDRRWGWLEQERALAWIVGIIIIAVIVGLVMYGQIYVYEWLRTGGRPW